MDLITGMVIRYLPRWIDASLVTIGLTAGAIVFGSLLGLLAAVAKVSRTPVFNQLAQFYTWAFRGTPLLVQIFIWYYGLPQFGIRLTREVAGVMALSINAGAYITEIIRAGIESIDKGQMEAARSLGMPYRLAMRRIILPQAYKRLLPPMANEFIALLKDSSLVSVTGMVDLMRTAQQINSQTFKAMDAFIAAALFYLFMTTVFGFVAGRLERRAGAYEG